MLHIYKAQLHLTGLVRFLYDLSGVRALVVYANSKGTPYRSFTGRNIKPE